MLVSWRELMDGNSMENVHKADAIFILSDKMWLKR